ncbi:hypothetical protein PR048_002280 [Dryococelus australis]|uniref:Uncharacterized protein n=1 Tax=Dryococelus australis TaxID=614101 RepID=A0ABQ9IL55_9NEOP|nr:hypothetical protein PR048_002280 [Dryococelus australis]
MSVQSKKRKVDSECSVFNDKWCVEYFVIGKASKALCVIYDELIAVLKEYNIHCNYKTKQGENFDQFKDMVREHKYKTLKCKLCFQPNIFKKRVQESEAVTRVSLRIAREITKRGKPFTDGDYIKNCMLIMVEELFPDKIEQCKSISLFAKHINRKSVKIFTVLSITLDEPTDVSDTAQVFVFFRVTEELADLINLHGTTTGGDIFKEVQTTLAEKYNLHLSLLKCVTIDCGKNMCGTNMGFIGRINAECEASSVPKPLTLHCILHQEALCGKSVDMSCVMNPVITVINFVRSHGLNCGKILSSFFSLRTEIEIFLYEKERSTEILSDKE